MKYLAILKDSLRETIDGKVFLVMIVLTLVAMIAAAQLSFTPEPPEKAFKIMLELPNQMLASMGRELGQGSMPSYHAENVKSLSDAGKPWNGHYKLDFVAKNGTFFPFRALILFENAMQGLRGGGQGMSEEGQRDLIRFVGIIEEAKRKPSDERAAYIESKLSKDFSSLSNERLENYVSTMMAGVGNLEVVQTRLVPDNEPGQTKFEVEVKGKANTFNVWPHSLGYFFGAKETGASLPLALQVFVIESQVVGFVGAAVFLLVSSIMTSFFIPNMLRKGSVDLLISKPIHRWALLLYKYVGGLLFMFLSSVVLIGGFWLVMGLRTNLWAPSFLLLIPILTFQFAIYYAASTLAAVLTRNTIVAIMASAATWLLLFVVGICFNLSKPIPGDPPSGFHKGVKVVHKVLPRVGDLDQLSQYVVALDLFAADDAQRKSARGVLDETSWSESIGVSVAFIAVLLGISCWWFSTRDY